MAVSGAGSATEEVCLEDPARQRPAASTGGGAPLFSAHLDARTPEKFGAFASLAGT